uniref:Uncharacterized protein n=1 Tax=Marseillevirus sp. TaxID=2809551 RepID=A0AA96EL58_9VIRU|nr:hypothetical protein MarFTMF_126 [Marseillevirus sp.]
MQRVLVSEFEADLDDPIHMYGVKKYKEIFVCSPYNMSVTVNVEDRRLFEIKKTDKEQTQRRPGDNFKVDISCFFEILPSGEEFFNEEKWRREKALVFKEETLTTDVCDRLLEIYRDSEKLEEKKRQVLSNIF